MSEKTSADEAIDLPEVYPLLPIRDLVVFPFMVVPLFVSRELSIGAVDKALAGERLLFLCAQKNAGADEPSASELYRYGTVGKILRMRKLPDGQLKILVQGLRRAVIDEVLAERPLIEVRTSIVDDDSAELPPAEVEGMIRAVKESLSRLSDVGKGLSQDVMTVLMGLTDPGALADLVASNLGLKVAEAQQVLEAVSSVERLRLVNETLAKEVEVVAWQQKIQTQAKETMSRAQREYFLREQLKQIRSELGDNDAKQEEIDELRRRLDGVGLPDEAKKEADKQLRRLDGMHADSAEAAVVRTYLDWLADLPWRVESSDRIDLGRAKQILDEDHYGLQTIKDRIVEYLGVMKIKPDHKGAILCFVGPPGVGKTSLGRSIARATGRKFVRISLGGVRDESEIRGHRRTYVGALPGRIIAGLKQAGTKNPVFMLDEIDKLGADTRGDPAAALLEVLDAEQNSSFRDHYLNLEFDLSRVLWLTTANLVDPIPAPLRDRMEMIRLPGYPLDEKVEIARRYLVPRNREDCGLDGRRLSFTNGALESIVESYTREAGVRELSRHVAAVCRKVARRAAEGHDKPVRITGSNVVRYLGRRRHDPDRPDEVDKIGLSTGLAWTEAGGAILHVEAVRMSGKGMLTLTGQLGKVMKESAQAALSCVRAKADALGLDASAFETEDFHVHVPQGAIPKDGPSAGITMATALVSVLGGHPVRRSVAMTGEITLRGRVLPIGGLREKLLAAVRAGIAEVVVPSANEADLAEVPANVRSKVKVHLVSEIEEVLAIALVDFAPKRRAAASSPASSTDPAPIGLA
jgi:ATP-dependent Lon protease